MTLDSKEFTDHKEAHEVSFTIALACNESELVLPTSPSSAVWLEDYIHGTTKDYIFYGATSPCPYTTQVIQVECGTVLTYGCSQTQSWDHASQIFTF